jgi:large conductance mechanosensitive channel
MIKEFKNFIMRGNVIELAVGIIIGAAFSGIVNSLIQDVITPLLLKPALDAAELKKLEELTLFGTVHYGMFLSSALNFIIIAFILFLIIKGVNTAMQKREEDKSAQPAAEIKLLEEIRDLLKSGKS